MPSGGGLLQLVAMGKQDVFLTGNPQITFFKLVYRRYTNFAIESCRMYFDGTPNFGQRITCLIPRQADLLGPLFVEVELPALTLASTGAPVSYVNSIGNALIETITIEVGEQEIDKQTGEFMELWSQLSVPPGQKDAYDNMIGRTNIYVAPQNFGPQRVVIPLQFWFCRNPGSYLPLLALQYHPIRINIKLRPLQDMAYFGSASEACVPSALNPASIQSIIMWGDYIYLDTEERRKFVSTQMEYLIEQVQYTPRVAIPASTAQVSVKMDFNHPIKELIWTVQRDEMTAQHEYFNYSNLAITDISPLPRTDNMLEAKLQFDGQDRFETRTAPFFRLIQPYQRHTNTPVLSFIYVYSFALRPEDVQPSGTVNASRLDTMNLLITLNPTTTPPIGNCHSIIYATNYNVFRVIDGFGGLLFKV
jgi:hypothetical protein